MGLVNLTTNLKSLRYGKDRIGGGSSGQPYIKTDIPDSFSDVGKTGGPDVILRGGTLVPGRAAKDVSRLTQMFFDFKSIGGPLFIAKENILSRTSVAIDGQGKALNNGVYLPTSTLLQSAGNSLGLHLNKQGIDPFKGIGKNGGGIFELFGGTDPLGQPSYSSITSNPGYESKLKGFVNSKINIKTTDTELLNYQGGPGSVLGIGRTRIPLAKNRTGVNNSKLFYTLGKVSGDLNNPDSSFTYTPSVYDKQTDTTDLQGKRDNDFFLRTGASIKYLELGADPKDKAILSSGVNGDGSIKYSTVETYKQKEVDNKVLEDFRSKNNKTFSLDYTKDNIETRVNLGNPGKKGNISNYQIGKRDAVGKKIGATDKINAFPLYKSGVVTQDKAKNDLVKFRIGIIQNDNPAEKVFIHFRAFLDGMSDNYSADWAGDSLMGRGEKFYRYNGFDRNISLGWTVVAQSKDELIPMYQKLNYLASTLSPDYSKSSGYMRGNLATLTVGGYLYEQPGIITGLSYNVPEESPWEIAIPALGGADQNNKIKSDKSVKEMPHMIKVSGFNFIPIHEFVPSVQKNSFNSNGKLSKFGQERYISLKNGVNDNYDGVNYIK